MSNTQFVLVFSSSYAFQNFTNLCVLLFHRPLLSSVNQLLQSFLSAAAAFQCFTILQTASAFQCFISLCVLVFINIYVLDVYQPLRSGHVYHQHLHFRVSSASVFQCIISLYILAAHQSLSLSSAFLCIISLCFQEFHQPLCPCVYQTLRSRCLLAFGFQSCVSSASAFQSFISLRVLVFHQPPCCSSSLASVFFGFYLCIAVAFLLYIIDIGLWLIADETNFK